VIALFIHSLKTKLIIFYTFLILLVTFIKISDFYFIQLPQLYALEALSDEKDISRINMAFTTKSNEYSVMSYDNAVWDETYHYINNRNTEFTENNFVLDTYRSLGVNGIHLYDRQSKTVWHQAWDHADWSPLTFPPFDQPSPFVKQHILISDALITKNNNRPISRTGFTFLKNKLILFSATSIFKANLKDNANGTMLFWRFLDKKILTNLQQRAGISFTIQVIQPSTKNTIKLTSKNDFIKDSYRTEKGEIFGIIPLDTGNGSIKFTYQAPTRQFSTSWLNHSTLITSVLFDLIQ
jgi:sensor domain CHASE-containing protein